MANPSLPDLLKDTSEPLGPDNEYFLVTILDLDLGTTYPLEFRWKYKDGTTGEWSAVYNITTQFATPPNTPEFLVGNVTGGAGSLTVEWTGNDSAGNPLTNIDRVEVWISEPPFDSTKSVYQSKTAFKTTIAAPAGSYTVALYAVTVNGAYSSVSSAHTVNVTDPTETIDTPTLPANLSVTSQPYSVAVNWDGTYSSGTFAGFKSIDIYAVSSDLGSSVTSGITSSNLVGSITVNEVPNKINIGLDNLRQALSLSTNSDVYSATIFYYHNVRNKSDVQYGSPTYTRINSSSVVPQKANYIDLASGVISIENLVAGNGTFSSWLRTGAAGGARIELSAVSDFSNGGNTVQKGLVAYSSGSTEIFNLDIDAGTLTINGSGTFTGNLSIGSSNDIFKADPTIGIWLGNATYASAPFRVSKNGALYAESGTIAGWQINSTFLQNTSGTFKISSTNTDPQIQVGSDASGHLRISPTYGVAHYSSGTTLSGKFTLSPTGTSVISGWTIGENVIYKGNTVLNSSGTNGYIAVGSSSNYFKAGEDGLQFGAEVFNDAPFRITPGASFVIGGGIITGTTNSVTFNLQTGNSITFASMPGSDDDNWAGDPTVTVRDTDSKLVKGRRIVYDSSLTPSSIILNPSSLSAPYDWSGGQGYYLHTPSSSYKPVKKGDLLLVEE